VSSSREVPSEAPEPAQGRSDADAASRAETSPSVERRRSPDRRHGPTPFWSAFSGRRRRRHGRRVGEGHDIYVDAFHRSDVLILVGIFVLNIFDALFTLIWLQRGGAEANPVMARLLELGGDHAFLIQKCFVVGVWLLILVVHKNFRIARLGLWCMLALYSLLILFHFALLASGADPVTGSLPEQAGAASERSDEARQERRNGALHAQAARPEAHASEADGFESLELELVPAALWPDGH
jgi:hypothetical protein